MLTLYGFGRVNSKVVGLTRDLRVLWTLEELGVPYRVHGVDHPAGETTSEPAWRRTLEAYEQRLGVPAGSAR